MAIPEVDALFALADMARKESERDAGNDEPEEEDDGEALFVNPTNRIRTGKPTITQLPDGDYHVCFGTQCPHAELNNERHWICALTGSVLGSEPKRTGGPGWTGRSIGSANPDDAAGTPSGGWIKRRDMFAASVAAHELAATMSRRPIEPSEQSQQPPLAAKPRAERSSAKRGALCVDAIDPHPPAPPAASGAGRDHHHGQWLRHGSKKLLAEAMTVISKLLIVDASSSGAAAPADAPAEPPKRQKLDPRLQNLEFVRAAALRRYARECSAGTALLNVAVLHDVCVHANEFVRKQRRLADAAAAPTAGASAAARPHERAATAGHVRERIAQLIVSLWRATCATPHMRDNKKGQDSFRPFAAGVLYSFKRGVYLSDGTCVVPALATLTASLPALRSAQSTPAAKQLQSSSHRGICSFHRSISSVAQLPAAEAARVRRLFLDAAQQAATLRELVCSIDGGA